MVERIMPDRDIVFGNTNPINTELTKQVIARTVLKSILQKHAKEQAEEQLQGLGEDGVKRFYNRFETLAQTFETLTRADATATALVTLFTLGFGG